MKQSLFALIILTATSIFYTSCNKDTTEPTLTSGTQSAPANPSQQRLLDLVNQARTSGHKCGNKNYPPVNSVSWNSQLADAAKKHSDYMNSTGKLDHTGEGGSNAGDRVTAAGYNWTSYGENIAEGYPTEEDVVSAWLASPGHCENIMNGDFTEMGVATSGMFWTQVFGSKD